MNLANLLIRNKILEEVQSSVNGKLTVVKDLTWGTYIKAGGLTQSGGILTAVWKETLSKVPKEKGNISNCLILGLGGGSLASLILKSYPNTKITGVDIDPLIVGLGIKYLDLKEDKIQIKITDAYKFKSIDKFDLICIDLYLGDKYPEKFEDLKFLKRVKGMRSPNGIAIFNRLYGPDNRLNSIKFGKKLEKIFAHVDYIFPQANLMLLCYN